MDDADDEHAMTEYLLGGLDEEERGRIFDRLGEDESFRERMSALEDDLILRWHHDTLTDPQREQFARAFATPARRARVEEALTLIRAAETSRREHPEADGASRSANPLLAPWRLPRFAFLGAAAVLAAAIGFGTYLVGRPPERLADSAASFRLSQESERAADASGGMERVRIPAQAAEVRLVVDVAGIGADDRLRGEISDVDRRAVTTLMPTRVDPSVTGATATFSIAPNALPDGDYVIRVRRTLGGRDDVVATRPFRVTRTVR